MKKFIIVLVLLLIPITAGASLDTNLYYGLRNNGDVRELQEFLIDKGFLTSISVTGNFLSTTLKAVKAYQKSIGLNGTGYVGILTRKAINDELATSLESSNQESVNETGTTSPAPTPLATTNDVIAQLQAQIALLTQQLQTMQAQQTTVQQLQQTVQQQTETIQQIQQNTQQIVQNTCTPHWSCTAWTISSASTQTRTCTDTNNCGTLTNKPSESQSCVPSWQCGDWSACTNSLQTRVCTSTNSCSNSINKPAESQSCVMPLPVFDFSVVAYIFDNEGSAGIRFDKIGDACSATVINSNGDSDNKFFDMKISTIWKWNKSENGPSNSVNFINQDINSTYTVICSKTGYASKTITGKFTYPPLTLVCEKRGAPISGLPYGSIMWAAMGSGGNRLKYQYSFNGHEGNYGEPEKWGYIPADPNEKVETTIKSLDGQTASATCN